MFNLELTDEIIQVATILLAQARITPYLCDCTEQCGCQYEINRFSVDVDSVEIVDRKIVHKLKLTTI